MSRWGEAVLQRGGRCFRGSAAALLLALAAAPAASGQELNPCEEGSKALDAGNYQEAVRYFTEAIRLNLQPGPSRFYRGYCYAELHQPLHALADYEAYAKSAPKDPTPWANRALVLQTTGDLRGAIASIRRATQLSPKDGRYHNTLAWLLAASPDAAVRNGKEAEAEARKACALQGPHQAAPQDTLAAAYAEQGRFDEAIAQQRAALKTARSAKGGREKLGDYRRRLDLYLHHQPCHQLDS